MERQVQQFQKKITPLERIIEVEFYPDAETADAEFRLYEKS